MIYYKVHNRILATRSIIGCVANCLRHALLSDTRSNIVDVIGYNRMIAYRMYDWRSETWPIIGHMINYRIRDRLSDTRLTIGDMIDYRIHDRISNTWSNIRHGWLSDTWPTIGWATVVVWPELPWTQWSAAFHSMRRSSCNRWSIPRIYMCFEYTGL